MAIEIRESFELAAPIEEVWRFLLDPRQVVLCMPGAGLDEILDDRTFLGTIRVKVGPVVTSYRGRVHFAEVDADAHHIKIVAEGRETAGSGSARATMTSHLQSLAAGGTEVIAEARAEISGRIVQFGQGMIQGVSHQLFLDFVARVKETVDAPPRAREVDGAGEPEAVRMLPVVLRAVWAAVVAAFRRLFRVGSRAGR